MKFELTSAQTAKYETWFKEQEAIALQAQLKNREEQRKLPDYKPSIQDWCLDNGYPYYGAIGGGCTFTFTPTSIGVLITVEHGFTKSVLNFFDDI